MKRTLLTSILSLFFIVAVSATLVAQTYPVTHENKEVEAVFKEADTNSDGYISWDEAQKAESQYKRDLYQREAFKKADTTGDDRLSRDEVGAYLEQGKTTEHMKMKSQTEGY